MLRRFAELATNRESWLPSADLAVARVADRVRLGGHDVPPDVVRRRYGAGLRNFFAIYRPLATTWRVYDNSTERPTLIAAGTNAAAPIVADAVVWERMSVATDNKIRIGQLFADAGRLDEALQAAARRAVLLHQHRQLPFVVWRSGKSTLVASRELNSAAETK